MEFTHPEEQAGPKKTNTDLGSILPSMVSERKLSFEAGGMEVMLKTWLWKTFPMKYTGTMAWQRKCRDASEKSLAWWQKHELSFLIFAKLAKGYPCIPASSTASDALFPLTAGYLRILCNYGVLWEWEQNDKVTKVINVDLVSLTVIIWHSSSGIRTRRVNVLWPVLTLLVMTNISHRSEICLWW